MGNSDRIVGWITVIVLSILMLIGFGSFVSSCSSGGSDNDSKRCESCGKTFTNNDDVSSIIWTNMCEPCYEDYKFMEDLREELKKYEERN